MDRVTAGNKGCIIQIPGVIILSVLTVKSDGVGVGKGGVRFCGQGTGRCTGFRAINSFYWTISNPSHVNWNLCYCCHQSQLQPQHGMFLHSLHRASLPFFWHCLCVNRRCLRGPFGPRGLDRHHQGAGGRQTACCGQLSPVPFPRSCRCCRTEGCPSLLAPSQPPACLLQGGQPRRPGRATAATDTWWGLARARYPCDGKALSLEVAQTVLMYVCSWAPGKLTAPRTSIIAIPSWKLYQHTFLIIPHKRGQKR